MADMQLPQNDGRRKIHALRVDLTPMVDLGFLLLSFFMYTTTIARPNTMEINMPVISEKKTPFCAESTITLVPIRNHKIVYYEGGLDHPARTGTTGFAPDGLRALLLHGQQQANTLPAGFSKDAHNLHVIIKPNDDCTYEDVVNVLDEMNVLDIRYYAITDITTAEKELVTMKLQ